MRGLAVVGLLSAGFLIGALTTSHYQEPEIVEVVEVVEIVEIVEEYPACPPLFDAVELVRTRSQFIVGPSMMPAPGVDEAQAMEALGSLLSKGVDNDGEFFDRLDRIITDLVEPCLE